MRLFVIGWGCVATMARLMEMDTAPHDSMTGDTVFQKAAVVTVNS